MLLTAGCTGDGNRERINNIENPVLAKINGQEVYLSEILEYFNLTRENLNKGRLIRKNYVEQFINDRIIYLEAEKNKVEIPDEQIKEALSGEMENIDKLSEKEYNDIFVSKRKQILVQELITSKFEINIKKEELKRYYKENYQEFYRPEMISIKQIFLDNYDLAKKVNRLAKSGVNFDELIEEYSISEDKGINQNIKYVKKGDMPEEFDKVIFSLRVNRVSDMVKSPYGYHIFKLIKKEPSFYIPFEKAKEKISKKLYEEKIDEFYQQWIVNKLQEYNVEINNSFIEG